MNDGHGEQPFSGADVREATFPEARRGYDQEAVHAFLGRVADWLEGNKGESRLTSEFAKVGERTAGILTAAEDAASKMRREAKEYAERLRSSAEEEARRAKLSASQKVDELIAEAESKANGIVEEAIARRRQLDEAVSSLLERREEITEQAQRVADQLLEAVEAMRADDGIDEVVEPAGEDGFARERTASEPLDERETRIHDEPQRR